MKSWLRLFLGLFLLWSFFFPPHSSGKAREQVILLHGYGRSASVMRPIEQRLTDREYIVHTISYRSLSVSIHEIEREVTQKVDQILKKDSFKTHFIGHSLGGLMIRAYLGKRELDQLGRVVLLGSPNQGTPAVDHLTKKWWFSLVGSAASALRSTGSKFLSTLPAPTYPLGVIAGVSDRSFIKGAVFSGRHDGLVPLESTKVKGMKDFCVVQSNHAALRYDEDVFTHILTFLRHGHFDCPPLK